MHTAPSPDLLCAALDRHAAERGDNLVFRFLHDGEADGRTTELTFAAFRSSALAVASALTERLAPGDRALLLYEGGIDFITAFFGCLYAGVIAVPTYPPDASRIHRTLPRLQSIVQDAGATLVLCSSELQRAAEPLCAHADGLRSLSWLPTDTLGSAASSFSGHRIRREDIAYLQYTSGSTGTPKGVIITHDNLAWACRDLLTLWPYQGDCHQISWLPTFHDLGLIWGLLTPLVGGFPVTFMLPTAFLQRPVRWLDAITRFRGTHTAAPNFAYDLCVGKVLAEQIQRLDLSSLRAAMNAAEPVRPHTMQSFVRTFGPVGFRPETMCPCYGLAEATLPVSVKSPETPPTLLSISASAAEQHRLVPPVESADTRTLVGCGRLAEQTRLAIVDPETRERLADNRVGRIWVAGPIVGRGYWERPDATAETFGNRILGEDDAQWLDTGDLGFVANGELFISGRAKDVLIIRGRNLYPQDLEQEVERAHPAVRPGCVAAFALEVDGEERIGLVAEIEPNRLAGAPVESLLRLLRLAVAESFDVQLHELALIPPRGIFKTSSGKIQRRRTRMALQSGELTLLAHFTAPRRSAKSGSVELPAAPELAAHILSLLKESSEVALPDGPIDDIPFRELGLDSASAVFISGKLAELLGRALPATLLFHHPTLRALVSHLTRGTTKRPTSPELSVRPLAAGALDEPIAVLGMACRMPGAADSPEALFALLSRGEDAVRRIPAARWAEAGAPEPDSALGWAGLLDDMDQFDAAFFGISPREAIMLDPQQRLLLETVWDALEDAGQRSDQLEDSATGVFVGLCTSDYLQTVRSSGVTDLHSLTGTIPSAAAGRISYTLGLRGPSMTVDTACSSSLVAVHLACQSLRLHESELAVVGGVNLILASDIMQMLAKNQALSPDGRSKTFDVSANGYVRGEGCGVIVLKRLSDALRDGDPIRACIKGSAVNHNAHAGGLTVPSEQAQQVLIRQALANARLTPDDIDYIETHGTGTSLGDPIEFDALRAVFGAPGPSGAPCVLGALKTNLGHLEAAAGIAGLIKVVACLQHQAIPPNLHLRTLNPRITLEGTRFQLPSALIPWPAGNRPRRAGVSSFGLSGTNAHVVLEEAPARPSRPEIGTIQEERSYVLPLSARSAAALQQLSQVWADALEQPGASLLDLAYTASCRRTHLSHRLAVLGSSRSELARLLREQARGQQSPALHQGVTIDSPPQVVLVFSGQGSQWPGMGRTLLRESVLFRQAFLACSQQLQQLGGPSVLAVLDSDETTEGAAALRRTEVAQPTLFALQVGLLAVLRAFGVEPVLVIGHSVGEVAAAYAAGILSLPAACALVLARARSMQGLAGIGKMVAVDLTEAEASAALRGQADVTIAAINGPRSIVLSGETSALQHVLAPLLSSGVSCRELSVDYAFHSPQMAEAESAFLRDLSPLDPSQASTPMMSTVTASPVQGPELTAAYWGRNLRQAVRFAPAVAQALQVDGRLFLEVGPHPVLCAELTAQMESAGYQGVAIPTLRRNKDDRAQILSALAALHVRGVPISWGADFPATAQVVPLPSYPWQRQRFWVSPAQPTTQPRIASDYYDSLTRLVESTQAQRAPELAQGLYLTFAPFPQVIPEFSWLRTFARPQEHPDFVRLMQQQQEELRQVLFRHVDFAACTRALDFGCGMSSDLLRLAHAHPHLRLDGYTISAGQAEFGKNRLREQGLTNRVKVYCRDSAKDPFPGQYDLVFGFEVAHHIKDKSALFANIHEHLLENGTLVLADFLSHVNFEIEHDASSSFFLTVEQWTELLSAHGLRVQDIMDVSRPISNFLHDPEFDARLAELRQAGEDENVLVSFQSYDRLGKMLDRGLASYILLSAKKVVGERVETLRQHNHAALTALLPYAAPSTQQSADRELLYGVKWRPAQHLDKGPGLADEAWLLIAQQPQTTQALAALLADRSVRCVQVHAGSGYTKLDADRYQIDLASSVAYQRLLQDAFGHARPCSRVVQLGALDLPSPEQGLSDQLGESVTGVCSGTTYLLQALLRHGFGNAPRLYLVTCGAQSVTGNEAIQAAHAVLWGLGKAVALECPTLRCTRLDLDPAEPVAAMALLRELSFGDREDQVALRGEQRYVARLVRASLSDEPKTAQGVVLRRDRSYLITGGLGGLGLELARWLVDGGAGTVVLAGRSVETAQTAASLNSLRARGARVISVQVDVCQPAQVEALIRRIEHSEHPLAGLFHLAGVLKDQTLLDVSAASLRTVLLPKVLGAWNLHQYAPADLDFFVLYSSAASLFGSPGQASYCAANAFLDALAHMRIQRGQVGMSIQWGAFAEVGMAAQEGRGRHVSRHGLGSLSIEQGHRILQTLLGRPQPVVGVLRMNARQWIESIPSAAGLPFFRDLAKLAGSEPLGNTARQLLAQLRSARPAERLPLLIPYLQQQLGSVLQLAPERIDPRAPFHGMGIDSLMSLEIRNRLEVGLGIRLLATALFTYPNLMALAQHLLVRLELADAPDAQSAAKRVPPKEVSSSDLDQLSDEDLARLGKDLLG